MTDNRPDPQALYERARHAASSLRSVLVSLATASIAFLYAAMFGAWEPALTPGEVRLMLAGIGLMGATLFLELVSEFANAQWSYWWAKLLSLREREETISARLLVRRREFTRDEVERRTWRWNTAKYLCELGAPVTFASGIALALVFIWGRAPL